MVGLPNVVTRAKLDGDQFDHFCVVGGRISGFPIDFGSRPYNTLPLPCQSVIGYCRPVLKWILTIFSANSLTWTGYRIG